ncbi:MAG: hypothetical protein AAGH46_11190 [Bacteroidota bacterium]
MEDNVAQFQKIAEQAFNESPNLYANGFINGVGVSDGYVIFQTNGNSTLVVNMPLSMAKTLGTSLLEMVTQYEKQTNQNIPTMEELGKLRGG